MSRLTPGQLANSNVTVVLQGDNVTKSAVYYVTNLEPNIKVVAHGSHDTLNLTYIDYVQNNPAPASEQTIVAGNDDIVHVTVIEVVATPGVGSLSGGVTLFDALPHV
jgi:hypothetical protein